jgi:xanthine dehydrogenase accessory factor
MDFYTNLLEIKESGKAAALCTIIETSGSTPRKAGSKMLVRSDGKTFGSVGGGKLELQVIEDALEIIQSGGNSFKKYVAGEENDMQCQGECRIFIEVLPGNLRLIIFGAGHVGQALAKAAVNLDFNPIVVDPRNELISKLDINGVEIMVRDYIESVEKLVFDERTFIVVCTPSHAYDEEVTLKCASKTHAYLGMIGSRKKVAEARTFFEKNGLDKEAIDMIDMPIGVPIACETPEEIAVSILAKIIDIKNK